MIIDIVDSIIRDTGRDTKTIRASRNHVNRHRQRRAFNVQRRASCTCHLLPCSILISLIPPARRPPRAGPVLPGTAYRRTFFKWTRTRAARRAWACDCRWSCYKYLSSPHSTIQPSIQPPSLTFDSRSQAAKLNSFGVCCTSLHAAARTVKAATSQLIAPAPNQAHWEGTTRRCSPPSPRCVPKPSCLCSFLSRPSPATLQSTPLSLPGHAARPRPASQARPWARSPSGRDHHLRRGSWRVRRR
jgi:hypothetical protein